MPRKRKRRSGAGQVYQRGEGGWRIRWRENGRRRHAHGYPDRETAERVLRKILADIAAGRAGLPPDPTEVPRLRELAPPWIVRRETTHRSWRDDRIRMNRHLLPFFGHLRPPEVTSAEIRRFVEAKLASGLSSTTTGHCVRLLSTFFTDVIEQGYASANPVGALPRSTRRLYRNAREPHGKPFLQDREDIGRLYRAMEQPHATIYAISALAGLRPGEVLALEWGDVDLEAGRILVQRQVRNGRVGPPKSGHARSVPIGAALHGALAEWRLATGGAGQLFAPASGGHRGRPARYVGPGSVWDALRRALKACGLPVSLTLYDCGRATFASHWVMGGGSMEKLAKILGHASVTTTERSYSRMRPDMIKPAELSALDVDLTRTGGAVIDMGARRAQPGQLGAAWAQGETTAEGKPG